MGRRILGTALAVAVMLACTAYTVAAQKAQLAAAENLGKDEKGRVVLDWEVFRELTEHERAPAVEPKLTLPWSEVEDLLGIKVKDVKGAELTLDWRQFKALLKWSLEKKKPKPVVKIPADYVVASSDFVGTLHKEGAVFELAMDIHVLKEEGWKRIPLLPATVALSEAKLPADCYLNVYGGKYEMLTAGQGPMKVELKFAAAVTEQAGAYQVQFDTVPGGTCTLKLTVPREKADVKVAGAQAVLPLEGEEAETVVGASLPSGAPVRIAWERALEVVEKVPPKLYAETQTLVAVGEGILTCRERVNLNVLHTGIRSVALTVPENVSVLEVSGTSVRDWRVADGKLDVRFTRQVIGASWLELSYEQALAKDETSSLVPVLRVEEAIREKGYIGVVAVANVEINALEHPGATGIDVRQLPAEIMQMTNQPVLLAFRYIGKELSIPLAVKKHEDVRVLLTIADSGVLTIMQTMDGRRITKAIYNVRNNRNQFLRVTLPDGAEVWTATVAGRSIRPALDEEGCVLIPLVRSGGARSELSSFPVELVYVEKQADVGTKGDMLIELPLASEPVTHMMVQLNLPAEGSYKAGLLRGLSFEGPLRPVESFSQIASAPRPPSEQVAADVQAKQLQEQYTKRVEADAVAAGVAPIRVRLPIRGKRFRFEKILVLDEPLWISFHYSGWEAD